MFYALNTENFFDYLRGFGHGYILNDDHNKIEGNYVT